MEIQVCSYRNPVLQFSGTGLDLEAGISLSEILGIDLVVIPAIAEGPLHGPCVKEVV